MAQSEFDKGRERGRRGELYSESAGESLDLTRTPSQTKERDRGFKQGKEEKKNDSDC